MAAIASVLAVVPRCHSRSDRQLHRLRPRRHRRRARLPVRLRQPRLTSNFRSDARPLRWRRRHHRRSPQNRRLSARASSRSRTKTTWQRWRSSRSPRRRPVRTRPPNRNASWRATQVQLASHLSVHGARAFALMNHRRHQPLQPRLPASTVRAAARASPMVTRSAGFAAHRSRQRPRRRRSLGLLTLDTWP